MRTKALRMAAVTLGLGVCTIVQAQDAYTSPAKWNNFRTVADNTSLTDLPAPAAQLPPPSPQAMPMEMTSPQGSALSQAVSAPWPGSDGAHQSAGCNDCNQRQRRCRPPLCPWFGTANLLFWTRDNSRWRTSLVTDSGSWRLTSADVDPRAATGFDIGFGRYFGCGCWGLGVNYLFWDPGQEWAWVGGTPGNMRAEKPAYNQALMNVGAGPESVYGLIDGSGSYAGAARARVIRNMSFQGLEVNLFNFGLMGARRLAQCGCGGHGYGGAFGPIARPCGSRCRVVLGHGFRWFQVRDRFNLAYDVDGTDGYHRTDIYDDTDITNDLFGYQVGGMFTYCLCCRVNIGIGGKFGLYGNRAEVRHRLGSHDQHAYLTAGGVDDIVSTTTDTALASLGELDLGMGIRLTNALTFRYGYRMLGVTGVADAVASSPYQSGAYNNPTVYAADSHLLHGGYVGVGVNW